MNGLAAHVHHARADTSTGSVPDDQRHMGKKTPGIMPGVLVAFAAGAPGQGRECLGLGGQKITTTVPEQVLVLASHIL